MSKLILGDIVISPTKVSQLENDANYIQDDVVSNGVYAVTAEGKLIAYNDAAVDATCLGVALITDNQRIMIEKMGEANAEWNSKTTLYWGKGLYEKNVAGITETTDQAVAKADFSGKEHTNAIITAYTEHSVDMDARDMCKVLQTFNDGENNGGFTDWYIPAAGQLYEIYTNKTNINAALTAMSSTAFSDDYYWSSSEYDSNYGWYVFFGSGFVNNDRKSYSGNRVRFVRDISVSKPLKERITNIEQQMPTKVSQLENDKNYIENGDGYNTGVYIAVQSGKLINPDEYDSTTETAVGVAVIDPKANFIIGLNHTASIPWGTSDQGLYGVDISGLTNYNSSSTPATDMDGIANTNVITAIYSGTACAAGYCRSKSITYGNDSLIGYLGSAGEWQIVINNYEAVKSAVATIGGNVLQSTSALYYWTSSEYNSSLAWLADFRSSGQLLSYDAKYLSASAYCVVPFYKIDNELTVLSKINLITTPAGSSTAPIYINSNGKITPTTYGGGTRVSLNGTSKGGLTASFYAPTSGGTSGYILKSNGSDAPSWNESGYNIKVSTSTSITPNYEEYYKYTPTGNATITMTATPSALKESCILLYNTNNYSISIIDSSSNPIDCIGDDINVTGKYIISITPDIAIAVKISENGEPPTNTVDLRLSDYGSGNYLQASFVPTFKMLSGISYTISGSLVGNSSSQSYSVNGSLTVSDTGYSSRINCSGLTNAANRGDSSISGIVRWMPSKEYDGQYKYIDNSDTFSITLHR